VQGTSFDAVPPATSSLRSPPGPCCPCAHLRMNPSARYASDASASSMGIKRTPSGAASWMLICKGHSTWGQGQSKHWGAMIWYDVVEPPVRQLSKAMLLEVPGEVSYISQHAAAPARRRSGAA
jgi:hypothetical protein